jgi:hypothetical protein
VQIARRCRFGHADTHAPISPLGLLGRAGLTFVMATLPHPPRLSGDPVDKLQHIAAFAVLTALARAAWPAASRLRLRLLIALSGLGALIEIVQAIPALHRDSDVMDWVAGTGATVAVLAIAAGIQREMARRQAARTTLRNGTSRRQ